MVIPTSQSPMLRLNAVTPKDGGTSSVTILTAYNVAAAFFESGMREYHALQKIHSDDENGVTYASFHDYIRFAVPSVSNLSFALEVHLKVLFAQRRGCYPRRHMHDIAPIYDELDQPLKMSLLQRFRDSCATDSFRYISEFSFEFADQGRPESPFQFTLDCVADTPPDLSNDDVFSVEVTACNDLYRRWRYLYERGISAKRLSARLYSLIHMNRAVAAEIASFGGGVLITGE